MGHACRYTVIQPKASNAGADRSSVAANDPAAAMGKDGAVEIAETAGLSIRLDEVLILVREDVASASEPDGIVRVNWLEPPGEDP
jgi:hydrogenase maturation factor